MPVFTSEDEGKEFKCTVTTDEDVHFSLEKTGILKVVGV